jgi:hypothetical protein
MTSNCTGIVNIYDKDMKLERSCPNLIAPYFTSRAMEWARMVSLLGSPDAASIRPVLACGVGDSYSADPTLNTNLEREFLRKAAFGKTLVWGENSLRMLSQFEYNEANYTWREVGLFDHLRYDKVMANCEETTLEGWASNDVLYAQDANPVDGVRCIEAQGVGLNAFSNMSLSSVTEFDKYVLFGVHSSLEFFLGIGDLTSLNCDPEVVFGNILGGTVCVWYIPKDSLIQGWNFIRLKLLEATDKSSWFQAHDVVPGNFMCFAINATRSTSSILQLDRLTVARPSIESSKDGIPKYTMFSRAEINPPLTKVYGEAKSVEWIFTYRV